MCTEVQEMVDSLQDEDMWCAFSRYRTVNVHFEFPRKVLPPSEKVFQSALCKLDQIQLGHIRLKIPIEFSS